MRTPGIMATHIKRAKEKEKETEKKKENDEDKEEGKAKEKNKEKVEKETGSTKEKRDSINRLPRIHGPSSAQTRLMQGPFLRS